MKIEVSNGEIIDKLTILEIKLKRIQDPEKLENIKREFEILNKTAIQIIDRNNPSFQRLYEVNAKLWDMEDRIRDLEKKKEFGKEFIETARMIYFTNDLRARIKNEINRTSGSSLMEEKSYSEY